MQLMKGRMRLATVALAAIAAVVAGGCGGDGAGSDKAGGAGEPASSEWPTPQQPGVLPCVTDFVSGVEKRSGGNVRIESSNSGQLRRRCRAAARAPVPPVRSLGHAGTGSSTRWGVPASRRSRHRC